MKKINKLYIIIILLLGVIYFGIQDQNNNGNNIKDFFIKNLNWDSPLQNNIPFVKGNDLELYYIIDNNNGNSADINIEKLQEKFDIKKIEIGGISLDIKNNLTVKIDQTTPLKITGKSKINNNNKNYNLKDLVEITVSGETEVSKSIPFPLRSEIHPLISQENGKTEKSLIGKVVNTNFNSLIFNNTRFNSHINNLLEISGENIKNIKYLNIGSYSFSPIFKKNKAYVSLEKNIFNTGNYFIFIQPISGNIVPLDIQIVFKNYPSRSVNIVNITPNIIKNNQKRSLVLQGNGFLKIISLQLNNNTIIKKNSFNIINDNVMSIDIESGFTPGKYHLNILTTDEIVELKNFTFRVTQ